MSKEKQKKNVQDSMAYTELEEHEKILIDIWNLKRMRMFEIFVKLVAVMWAVMWTGVTIVYFFSEDSGSHLLSLLVSLPALGFWALLIRSAGSVRAFTREIKELKKKLNK